MELSTLISSMLRLGVPLLLAALGVLVTSKSGIVNMGMEGNMLLGAFAAVYGTNLLGNPLLGVLAAVAAGILYALSYGFFIIFGRGNHIVCGLGLNFVAIGATYVLTKVIWDTSGWSTSVKMLPHITIPWLGNQSISLIFALLAIIAVWFLFNKMNLGLRIRAIGENPATADSLGVSVVKYQFLALVIAGALGGLGGAELSVGQIGYFIKEMTAGKGFLAYSAVIFAGYNPLAVVVTTMMLSLFDALQMRAQLLLDIPGQFLLTLPYLVTLFSLIGVSDRKKPKAIGKTYVRGNF